MEALPEFIEASNMPVDGVAPIASWSDTRLLPVSGVNGAAGGIMSPDLVAIRQQRLDTTQGGDRREKLKRKLPVGVVTQEPPEIKRQLLQRLQATDDDLVQTMGQWSSTMDRLNSNIEKLVQSMVSSGTANHLLKETDITRFPFAAVAVKTEADEEQPQSSQLHQSQT